MKSGRFLSGRSCPSFAAAVGDYPWEGKQVDDNDECDEDDSYTGFQETTAQHSDWLVGNISGSPVKLINFKSFAFHLR